MPIHNIDVARYFRDMADLLDIQGADYYRVRAYRTAAHNIQRLPYNVRDIAHDQEKLQEIPGIGQELSKKIQTIADTGSLPELEELKTEIPPGLLDLLAVEGLGPKRVKTFYQELGVETKDDLKAAGQKGRIQELEGFGQKIEQKILNRLEADDARQDRFLRPIAQQIITPYLEYLQKSSLIQQLEVAGSYRRKLETVGDIDILAVSQQPKQACQYFIEYEDVDRILNQGETKASIILTNKLQVDLRVVNQEDFGAALLYFTGSKDHNIALRRLALDKNWKLNEYGLFKKNKNKQDQKLVGTQEQAIYQKLDLSFIPPELREARGEIEAALADKLPDLVKLSDIKADLQMHTTASDGVNTLAEMAAAVAALGYEYIAITDHSQSLKIAHGLTQERFQQQFRAIEEFNHSQDQVQVLKAAEVDILKNGELDFDDEFLAEFDLVLGSIHSHFDLSEKEQTQRVLTAMQSPHFHILAHPTGRIINSRSQYEIDLERIMQEAKKKNIILEINAHPSRLDLNDRHVRLAKEIGVKLSLGTDAHQVEELKMMQYGVDQARRGWAEAADIVNTYSWTQFQDLLQG